MPAGALRRQGGKARARVTVCFDHEVDVKPPTLSGCLRMPAGLTVRKYSEDAHSASTWLVGHSSGTAPPLAERFVGCLLGLAVGHSLGSPLEGWAAPEITSLHPTGIRQLSARNDLK